jgi:hypothetical protein
MTFLSICAMWIIPLAGLYAIRVLSRPDAEKVPSWTTASATIAARSRGLQRLEPERRIEAATQRSYQGHFVRSRVSFGPN